MAVFVGWPVKIEKKKPRFFTYGPANVPAELVEVVTGLNGQRPACGHCRCTLQVINRIVGVESAVAEEFERGAVKYIASRLCHYVDDSAAGAAELGAVAIGVHLELLDRIL